MTNGDTCYKDITIISPYKIIELCEMCITAECNEHIKLEFTGMIDEEQKENENSELSELYFTDFVIESGISMRLGDHIIMHGIDTKIHKTVFKMSNGVLCKTFYTRPEKGLTQSLIKNKNIRGLYLNGTVLDRKADEIKLKLDIDNENPDCGTRWFKYQSCYVSRGNAGLYFMPEKNHFARVYVPTDEEKDAYAMNAIRKDGDKNPKTNNPDVKLIGTEAFKELRLDPSQVKFTALDGKRGKVFLQMNAKDGIKIHSDKGIKVNSKSIYMAGGTIKLKAGGGIKLKNGGGVSSFDGGINFQNAGIDILAFPENGTKPPIINKNLNISLLDLLKLGISKILCGESESAGDPVDVVTGNFFISQTDLIIRGSNSFSLERFYNSLDNHKGILGHGWHHNFDMKLVINEKNITIIYQDGRNELFEISQYGKLIKIYDNTGRNAVYKYDGDFLTYARAINGGIMKYAYDKDGQIVEYYNPSGTAAAKKHI